MRLNSSDLSSLPNLLDFLRAHGCIAYYVEDADEIAAMVPDLTGTEEASMIRTFVEHWRCSYPVVEVEVIEG